MANAHENQDSKENDENALHMQHILTNIRPRKLFQGARGLKPPIILPIRPIVYSEKKAMAGGVAKKMDKFHFVYGRRPHGLAIMLVLDHSDHLSDTFQNPKLCTADAHETTRLVVQTLPIGLACCLIPVGLITFKFSAEKLSLALSV